MKISTNMATGAMWRATVRAGGLEFCWQDGLRIALAIGLGWGRGVGRGWKMNLGDLLHSTTGGGHWLAADGCGFLDGAWCGLSPRQRGWPGWVAGRDLISRSRLEQEWDGSRWPREKCLFRV